MLELKGKYNIAKVFTDNVDNETISQVIELLNQDYIKDAKIRIMPDCHAGAGCVIGTTMTISDKVCPNLVGVDIGCGMLAVRIAEKDIDLPKLDDVINAYVPAGFNVNEEPLGNFSHLKDLVAPADISLAYRSIGRLGGGNHFIELDKDTDDNIYLVIHSGSRSIGQQVCNFYQNLAIKNLNEGHLEKVSKDRKNNQGVKNAGAAYSEILMLCFRPGIQRLHPRYGNCPEVCRVKQEIYCRYGN